MKRLQVLLTIEVTNDEHSMILNKDLSLTSVLRASLKGKAVKTTISSVSHVIDPSRIKE